MSDSDQSPAPEGLAHDQPLEELLASDKAAADRAGQNGDSVAEAAEQLDRLQNDLTEAQNQVLRAQAELENFRKRVRREMDDERRFANLPLISDLLGVLDNLLRAIDAAEQAQAGSGLLEGVKMVATQLQGVLEKHHCRPIQAEGALFDPHLHQAIAQQPTTELPPGTVTNVAALGYQLHERVIRPSQVVVAVAPDAGQQDNGSEN